MAEPGCMRVRLALAILLGTMPAAFAQGFEIVVPNRPDVPIVINGTVCVTFLALTIPDVEPTTITEELSATSSVVRLVSRSNTPSANRYSIATFCPST